jgi:hypothetical protein
MELLSCRKQQQILHIRFLHHALVKSGVYEMPRTEADDLGRILTMTSWQISRTNDLTANQVIETPTAIVIKWVK